jgi:hypothetical protein
LTQAGLFPDRLGVVWQFHPMTVTAAGLDYLYAVM